MPLVAASQEHKFWWVSVNWSFHKQVVNTNVQVVWFPKNLLLRSVLFATNSGLRIIDEPKANTSVGPYPEIIRLSPASNGPCISEIDGLTWTTGRSRRCTLSTTRVPRAFYVTPSLKNQKFQKITVQDWSKLWPWSWLVVIEGDMVPPGQW